VTAPVKPQTIKRGKGRESVQGGGKSPVLQIVVSPELKETIKGYGMDWAREVLTKAVARKKAREADPAPKL